MECTVVIPAYNEEGRLPNVLAALLGGNPSPHRVIVVSDGSTDRTAAAAAGAGVELIQLPENRGKGAAMWAGAQACRTGAIAFLDADLRGLRPEHVRALLAPVVAGEADMTVGLFRGGRGATDLSHGVTPWISGQRAMLREAFLSVPQAAGARQGVEALLTRAAAARGWRVRRVPWHGVTHAMKEEKLGLARGLAARLRMYAEVARGWTLDPDQGARERPPSRRRTQ